VPKGREPTLAPLAARRLRTLPVVGRSDRVARSQSVPRHAGARQTKQRPASRSDPAALDAGETGSGDHMSIGHVNGLVQQLVN
jgi:hypothetical protein